LFIDKHVEWRNGCKSGTYINGKRTNKMTKNQWVARKGKTNRHSTDE
jgi:hypothetical protein